MHYFLQRTPYMWPNGKSGCGRKRISYNSCRNRHCPKCQASKQAFWVEDLMQTTLPVKHYHIVFTVPHELNQVCLVDSKWFYSRLFACVWETLRQFGYSRFVKIRRYGIYSSRARALKLKQNPKMVIRVNTEETSQQRIKRLTGFDLYLCPFYKEDGDYVRIIDCR